MRFHRKMPDISKLKICYYFTNRTGTQIIACLVGIYYTTLFVFTHFTYVTLLKRMSIYVTGPIYIIFIPLMVVCLVLFYGAYEERANFVLVWLICNNVTLILALVVLVEVNRLFTYVGITAGSIMTILATAFSIYAWTVVYVYYLQLKKRTKVRIEEESEEETNDNNTAAETQT